MIGGCARVCGPIGRGAERERGGWDRSEVLDPGRKPRNNCPQAIGVDSSGQTDSANHGSCTYINRFKILSTMRGNSKVWKGKYAGKLQSLERQKRTNEQKVHFSLRRRQEDTADDYMHKPSVTLRQSRTWCPIHPLYCLSHFRVVPLSRPVTILRGCVTVIRFHGTVKNRGNSKI